MNRDGAPDPFTVFGIEHRLDLDERALERRYLQLSRDCHPDRNRGGGAADCAAVLARAAEINDSWRVLKDRWERARVLIELRAPGVLDDQKQLDPEFLAGALERAEMVANAESAELPALRQQLRADADAAWHGVRDAATAGDFATAARRLHESKYVRKAMADLEARAEAIA
jgi:Fe-S protein assembly co-chaperone HscB